MRCERCGETRCLVSFYFHVERCAQVLCKDCFARYARRLRQANVPAPNVRRLYASNQ